MAPLLVARDLEGRRIRRVDVPMDELVALTLDTKEVLLIAVSVVDKTLELGLDASRPRGRTADGVVRRLRKWLENATITRAVFAPELGADLEVSRGSERHHFVAMPTARGVAIAVLSDERLVVVDTPLLRRELSLTAGAFIDPFASEESAELSRDELVRRGARALAMATTDVLERARREIDKALTRARARLEKRLRAIEEDARRADDAPRLRTEATLLLGAIGHWKRGSTEVEVLDYHSDPPRRVTLDVDPREGPKVAADAHFKRARRLERGAEMALSRHALTEREIATLEALGERARRATEREALEAVAREATARGVRGIGGAPTSHGAPTQARGKKTSKQPARAPYRRFLGFAERPILVGRGAADNDELTTKHARPYDLWLHARGQRGAHVIVPLTRGEACPPELLGDAAMLTAHFSDARGEPVVEVQYVERRHVRKPRGAAVGAVLVDREKVMMVRRSEERLAWLLARERF